MSNDVFTFISTQLIPSAIQFFQQALQVIPYPALLTFQQQTCNNASIPSTYLSPGAAADFVMFVTSQQTNNSFIWSSPCILSPIGNRLFLSYHKK